ncbi:hypothetical protein THAOC_23629 [Thalassiosira oceanica]|uniref:Uncharacterized protein n=1 Tax=Thalassiosira oceanica TaxID=159749 RepID=K0RVK1_THAOC|nr:hypothetical protein THAOC_23629 [Thalassiosira oceanica]|eukprot:EJK56474.1 hypothetical protein THAOC_23629 [Thalassiosira oceanica]
MNKHGGRGNEQQRDAPNVPGFPPAFRWPSTSPPSGHLRPSLAVSVPTLRPRRDSAAAVRHAHRHHTATLRPPLTPLSGPWGPSPAGGFGPREGLRTQAPPPVISSPSSRDRPGGAVEAG